MHPKYAKLTPPKPSAYPMSWMSDLMSEKLNNDEKVSVCGCVRGRVRGCGSGRKANVVPGRVCVACWGR